MKIAVVGSRGLSVPDLEKYLPAETTELISGGARGVDACARAFAGEKGIHITEFLPDYPRYGRGAPLKRNEQIVAAADGVVAFWDGSSRGTADVIARCAKENIPLWVFKPTAQSGVYAMEEQK